jgi:hypothetical protein
VGNGADAKEHSIGTELAARHALHAKADFQFLDPIFRGLPTLAVPHVKQRKQINVSSLLGSVRFYDVVPFAVKGIAYNVDAFHFFVADLSTSRIFAAIQSTLDL